MFYVYEDWTLELEPRCFYVGKGDVDRVAKLKRSKYHDVVVAQYGQRRVVVLSTEIEEEAFALERRLIAERHTHPRDPSYNGIGCNRTTGGQGGKGRIVTAETGRRISAAKKGKPLSESNRRAIAVGMKQSLKFKAMNAARKGTALTEEHKRSIAATVNRPEVKELMITKVTAVIRDKYANDPTFYENIVRSRARGEKSGVTKFTTDIVLKMRGEWELLDKSIRGAQRQFFLRWAAETGASGVAVRGIVLRKTWKHI